MVVKVFTGHSVQNMDNAATYALRKYDDYVREHESHETEHISTAVHVDPTQDNYNYWYVMTVAFVDLDPTKVGKGA